MIVVETLSERLKRTYSDNNKVIRKIGTDEHYTEAIDLISKDYEYEETDIEIEEEKEQAISKLKEVQNEIDTTEN
ncbi:MAG: hypothetical protein M0R31_06360 [Candidatus Riflebacteria bacterium]|nr:hypothetical protein [Candidatus Riflebacteria bacterium]